MDEAEPLPGNSGAVSEFVAACRLGLSVETLPRDRRIGQLGIPFVKYGSGRCGAVRYDLVDLERFIESKKRRTLPKPIIVEVQAPVIPGLPPVEPEPVAERIDPPMPVRRSSPRTMWDAIAARYTEEPEPDPFATGRPPRHRTPSRVELFTAGVELPGAAGASSTTPRRPIVMRLPLPVYLGPHQPSQQSG